MTIQVCLADGPPSVTISTESYREMRRKMARLQEEIDHLRAVKSQADREMWQKMARMQEEIDHLRAERLVPKPQRMNQ